MSRTPEAMDQTPENLPALDYLQRVGSAGLNAFMSNTFAMSEAWSQIQSGNYGFEDAMKTWARLLENALDVAREASLGPGYLPRPDMLFFHVVRGGQRVTLKQHATLASAAAGRVERTPFSSRAGATIEAAEAYIEPAEFIAPGTKNGARFGVQLSWDAFASAAPGLYESFIYPGERGPVQPHVIVHVRVVEAGAARR